jgi:hypothetical protein
MNDDEMLTAMRSSLTAVKESLTDVRMDRSADTITGRARRRRLGRGLSAAGAAGVALGVGLAVAFSGGQQGTRPVHVNLDAWSVDTTSSGQVNVTIRDLKDPALLRQTLAEAGVPAIVTSGEVCGTGKSLPQMKQVLIHTVRDVDGTVFTIDPAAMPSGSELSFGRVSDGPPSTFAHLWFVNLISKDGHVTCAPAHIKTGN